MSDYENGISITNHCYNCMLADAVCTDCTDLADARLTDKAHELVDDGNLQYEHAWLINRAMPSGHDWTDREGEYKLPIVFLQDGGEYEELWELDDERQKAREVECQWCHILTPKVFNDCQSCDHPLEHNVSNSLLAEITRFVQ